MTDENCHLSAFFERIRDIGNIHRTSHPAGMPPCPTIFMSIIIFHTPTYSNFRAKKKTG
jgi:hypothetical protein